MAPMLKQASSPNSQLMPLPVAQGMVPAAVPTLPAPRRVSTPTPKLLGTRSYMQLGPYRVSNQTRSGKWLNIWTRTLKKMNLLLVARDSDVGDQMMSMKGTQSKSMMSTTMDSDVQQNSVINANTLMTALDGFLECVQSPDTLGTPIKFYTTKVGGPMAGDLYYKKYQDEIVQGHGGHSNVPGQTNPAKDKIDL